MRHADPFERQQSGVRRLAGGLTKRLEVPGSSGGAYELDFGVPHLQRVQLDLTLEQRQEPRTDVELTHANEWTAGIESLVLCDRQVSNTQAERDDAEAHRPERHPAPETRADRVLDLPAIPVDVDDEGQRQSDEHDEADRHEDEGQPFP